VIRFWELLRCTGVDEDAAPFPGMIIPFRGANFVLLETGGNAVSVSSTHPSIDIEEVDSTELRRNLMETNIALSQPGVDPKYKESMMPTSLFWYEKPRFFLIHGNKHVVDFPGATVQATAKGKLEASLRVVVLDKMPIKIAIRNVQIPGENGKQIFHSRIPCDPDKERDDMNAVWTPQTNIIFNLIPSEPAFIDTRKQLVREKLARGFGLKSASDVIFPQAVDPGKVKDLFRDYMIDGAEVTFFLVDQLQIDGDHPDGTMNGQGMGFIAGRHFPTTFAHEAGHFLGGHLEHDQWHDLGHTFDQNPDHDTRMLMRDGGAGWKIPFNLVKQFREFFKRHPRKAH
jgi:hypothetical protein